MKPKTVTYSKTFPIPPFYEKIIVELELHDGDDPRLCLYEARKIVNDFHYESNAAEKKRQAELDKPSSIIDDINACTDIKTLEGYQLLAKNNPALREVYDKKIKELQNV